MSLVNFVKNIPLFVRDHFYLLFRSAAHNHLRIQTLRSKNDGKSSCVVSFESYSHLKRYQKKTRMFTFGVSSLVVFLVAVHFFSDAPKSYASGTDTWVGGTSSDWATAANWSTGVVPGNTDDVVINGSYTNAPVLNLSTGSVTVNSLSIGSSAASVLTVSNGSSTNQLITVGDVNVGASGTLTHAANTNTQTSVLNLQVGGNLTVTSGGKIDISSKGFAGAANGSGYGAGAGAGTIGGYGGGGGGYGGNGGAGQSTNAGGTTYGSITQPTDIGSSGGASPSGGTGGSGGGAAKIVVTGTLTDNGTINANGGTGLVSGYAGGGSGGSVWIQTGTFAGSGTITANGGNADGTGYAGGGGGGRISLNYTTNSYTGTKTAFGGTGLTIGGAGTIYTKLGSANGDLLVDNNSQAGANTTQVAGTNFTFGNVTVTRLAVYVISNTSVVNVASSISGNSSNGYITVNSGATLNLPTATYTLSYLTINNNGTIGTVTNLTLSNSTFYQNGTFSVGLTDLTVGTSSTWEFQNLNTTTAFTLNNLTIQSGGTVTHTANASTQTYTLNLNITNNLNIQSGGKIDVSGRGFVGRLGGSGYGSGAGAGGSLTNGGGGGGYGGSGGAGQGTYTGGTTYGSVTQPTDIGSSGGGGYGNSTGGSGGGSAKIVVSGTLTDNGTINANGNAGAGTGAGAGGSGGSIWVNAGTITGAGSITANGGNAYSTTYAGGGGGGRISLNYTTNSYTGTKTAFGGTGLTIGGAGTIYTKLGSANGDLLVDNNSQSGGAATAQVAGTNFTFDNVTITKAAAYVITGTSTLVAASTLTSNSVAASITVNSGATLNLPTATYTLSYLTINNNGTIGTVTNLTLSNSTFYQNGTFSVGLTDLTVGTSSTWEFQNLNTTTAFTLNNLTIQSGGTVTHTANASTQTYTLNLNITNNLNIQSGGKIDVSGRGFVGHANTSGYGSGAGAGTLGSYGGGGGGYGGNGGAGQSTNAGGTTYGSVTQPTDIGSSGGASPTGGTGGSGGGAAKIVVTGTLTDNGTINANGGTGLVSGYAGGGSGGSVWIQTGTFAGSGTITANGGNAYSTGYAGGGGGGRIAIGYTTTSFNGTYAAAGGTGLKYGSTGTINALPPVVTSVTPSTTYTTGGNVVTISGSNFYGVPSVLFGTTAATSVTLVNSNTLNVVATAHSIGTYNVIVTNPDGLSGTLSNGITFVEYPPSISSIAPSSGPTAGGTNVTISGNNFISGIDSYTKLLLHADSTNGSTTFIDSSPAPHAMVSGNSAQISTAQAKFGGSSIYFNGSGAYVDTASSNDFDFSTSDFTIDFWINQPALVASSQWIIDRFTHSGTSLSQFGISINNGIIQAQFDNGSTVYSATASTAIVAGTWNHVAIERHGTNGYVYLNGVLVSSISNVPATLNATSQPLYMGVAGYGAGIYGGYYLSGYLDEINVSKGIVRWSSNFTPPIREYVYPQVTIGGVLATNVLTPNSTTITATTPAGNNSTVDVTVTNYDGQSATLSQAFTYNAGPTITAVTPATGYITGGDSVTVTGANFSGTPVVTFGSTAATSVTLVNSSTLTVVTPAHLSGTVNLSVANPDGQVSTLTNGFTFKEVPPSISSITPTSGPLAGGTNVTIIGNNFKTGATYPAQSNFNKVWFVNTTGSDTTGDGSISNPFASLYKAVNMAASGDGIDILPGTYRAIPFNPTTSATCINDLNKNLTIFGNDANTILECYGSDSSSSNSRDADVITLQNSSSIVSNIKINYYPNRSANYSNAIFKDTHGTFRNIFVENKSTTSWSYSYNNNNYVSNIYNSIFKSNGYSTSDYSGSAVTYDNVLFDATPSLGTKNYSLTRSVTSNDSNNAGAVPSDLANTGDPAITNPDGTRSNIGVLGGTYSWLGATIGVSFGGVQSSNVSFINSTTLYATAPTNTVGPKDVTVTNYDGQSVTLSNGYLYSAPPSISSITPSSGSKIGGDAITITGTNFWGTPTVSFGTVNASSVILVNSTTLSVITPAHTAGTFNVTVTNADGQNATLSNGFTFNELPLSVSSLSPTIGSTLGGARVTISGNNFVKGGVFPDPTSFNKTWYVSTTGNDTTGDGSVANPFASLYKAVNTASTGDAIDLLPGTYRAIPFINSSGSGSSYCVNDLGKGLIIFGNDADTVLQCYGSDTASNIRDAHVASLQNNASVVSNMEIDFYPNRGTNYSNSIFNDSYGTYRNIFVVNKSTTSWSYEYSNSNLPFNVYNSIFESNGYSSSDYSGVNVTYDNVLFDATPSLGTKNYTLTRSVTSTDWDINSTLTNDLVNTGDPAITNPDGSRSNIGVIGGMYFWGPNYKTNVTFGGVQATNVFVKSSTTLYATTPANPAGIVDVKITDYDGQNATLSQAYTYVAPPTVSAISPTSVVNNRSLSGIIISGQDFQNGATAKFTMTGQPDIACTNVVFTSSTQISCDANFTGVTAGNWNVAVTNPDGQQNILPNGFQVVQQRNPYKYVFTQEPATLNETEVGTYVLEAQDQNGNPMPVDHDTAISLVTSTPTTGTFATDLNANPATMWDQTSVILANGQSSATFYYKDSQKGTKTISANAPTGESTLSATQTLKVTSKYRLLVTGVTNPIQASVPSSVTVQAVDYLGNVAPDYVGTVHFSSNDLAAIVPANTTFTSSMFGNDTFTNGVTMMTQGTWCVNAVDTLDSNIAGYQCGIVTNAAPAGIASSIKIVTASQTVPAGEVSQPINVQLEDINGNIATRSVATTLYVRETSSTGKMSADGSTNWASGTLTLTIPAGSSAATFYYKDLTIGSYSLSVSDDATAGQDYGLANDSQAISVIANSPNSFAFGAIPATLSAGTPSQLDVVLKDIAGNQVDTPTNQPAYITSSNGGQFSLDGSTNWTSTLATTILAGSSDVKFYYRNTTSGQDNIVVSDSSPANGSVGLIDASQNINITGGGVTQFVFVTNPYSAIAGQLSSSVTVEALDVYGNVTTVPSGTNVYLYSNNANTEFSSYAPPYFNSVKYVTIPAGNSATSFYVEQMSYVSGIQITASDNATTPDGASGIIDASQNETITPGAVSSFAITNAAPYSALVDQETGVLNLEVHNNYGVKIPLPADQNLYFSTTSTNAQFSLNPSPSWSAITSTVMSAGSDSMNFYYKDSQAGTQTITAGDDATQGVDNGIKNATLAVKVVSQNATQLKIVTPSITEQVGQATSNISVELLDQYGNAATPLTDTAVNLSSNSATGTFLNTSNGPITQIIIPAGSSLATFLYKDTTAGNPIITVSASSLTSDNQTENIIQVTPTPTKLLFQNSAQTLTVNAVGTFTAELANDSNQATASQNPVTVGLSSDSATGTFLDANNNPITQIVVPAGSTSATFRYKDSTAGTPTLTISATGLTLATQQETIANQVVQNVSQIVLSAASNAYTSDKVPVAITTEDSNANPSAVISDTTVNLTQNGSGKFYGSQSSITPVSTAKISAGTSSTVVYFQQTVPGNVTINAAETPSQGWTAGHATIDITAKATNLIFASQPQSKTAGTDSDQMTVTLGDAYGNLVNASSDLVLNLASSSPSGQFSLATGGDWSPVTTITMKAGTNSAAFYYMDTLAQTQTLTVAGTGLVSATQNYTITAAGIYSLNFVSAPQNLQAGQVSALLTVQAHDQYGNVQIMGSNLPIYFYSTSAKGSFSLDNNFASQVTGVMIPAGQSAASFYYKDTAVNNPTIAVSDKTPLDSTDQGIINAIQTFSITQGAIAKLVWDTMPTSVEAGKISSAFVVKTTNAYGVEFPVAADQSVYFSSDSQNGSFSLNTDGSNPTVTTTITAGSSRATFYYEDTQAGIAKITVSDISTPAEYPDTGLANAVGNITVDAGQITAIAFNSPAQTIIANHPSTAMQIQLLNENGVPTAVKNDTLIYLRSSSIGGQFSSDGTNWGINGVTVPAGSNNASFYYHDSNAGTPVITAADTLPISPDINWTNAAQSETINAQQLDHFNVNNVSTPQLQGTPSSLVIMPVDSDGYVVQSYDGTITNIQAFDDNGNQENDFLPATPITFDPSTDKGVKTLTNSVAFYSTGVKTIKVKDSKGLSGSQQNILVNQGNTAAVKQIKFVDPTGTFSVAENTTSQLITVQLRDSQGNVTNATDANGFPLRISANSDSGEFSTDGKNWSSKEIVLNVPQKLSFTSFYYRNSKATDDTLTAMDWVSQTDDSSISNDTLNATISAGVADHLEISGSISQIAGDNQEITITAVDSDGNVAKSYDGEKEIALSGAEVAITGDAPTCSDDNGKDVALGKTENLNFSNGVAKCQLKLYLQESATIQGNDGSISTLAKSAWALPVNVVAAAMSKKTSVLDALPNPQEMGASVTAIVTPKDVYENIILTGGENVTLNATGANTVTNQTFTFDAQTDTYRATYYPQNSGTDLLTATISSGTIEQDTDGTSDGIYHEVINGAPVIVSPTEPSKNNSNNNTNKTVTKNTTNTTPSETVTPTANSQPSANPQEVKVVSKPNAQTAATSKVQELVQTISAVSAELALATAAGSAAVSLPSLLQIIGSLRALSALPYRKKQKLGIVYDAKTGKPIPYASVAMVDEEDKTLEIKNADRLGFYSFLARKGTYKIIVRKEGYVPVEHDSLVSLDIYYANSLAADHLFEVEGEEEVVSMNIPMWPQNEKGIKRIFSLVVFKHILFWLGFAFSVFAVATNPTHYNIAILLFFVAVLVFTTFYAGRVRAGKITTISGKPIPFATIKLLDKETSTLIARTVANEKGKFVLVGNEGAYILEVQHGSTKVEKEIVLDKRREIADKIII